MYVFDCVFVYLLRFYDEVEQLEQLTSINEVIEKAKELSSLYVVQGASKQVRLARHVHGRQNDRI